MKKIGIITHYYGSINYGGLLQAYALCKKLNDLGYIAEQICYQQGYIANDSHINKMSLNKIFNGIKYRIKKIYNNKLNDNLNIRKHAILEFADAIPHSNVIYNASNIVNANNCYDFFITGSDQVWNLDWYEEAYFLKFVKDKPKYAYAASLGTNKINDNQKEIFRNNLKDFTKISVRERDSISLLNPITKIPIDYVLDPTLLLTQEEWEGVTSERLIGDDYLFCYFLGNDLIARRLAKEYAKKKGLRIVNLPHLGGQYRKCDINFGDIDKYDISPSQFISLIKYSKCIFTDSFHAAVFSNIYHKEFFVFKRDSLDRMSNRIYSLCQLFNNEYRFCYKSDRTKIQYLLSIKNQNYENYDYKQLVDFSIDYLKNIGK